MPRWLATLLTYVLILGIPVFLILTNVLVFMSPEWLIFQYNQPGFPKANRFTDAERRYFATESIEYVRGNRTLEQFKALGVYEDREIKHMIDVRELVDKVKVIDPAIGVLMLIAFVGLLLPALKGRGWGRAASSANTLTPSLPLRGGERDAARGLFGGAVLTIGLFAFIGIFAAIGFNTFFTLFHRMFFEGDSWLFLYTDSLIQFYPLPFWYATSITLVVLTIVEALIIGAIGWFWGRRI